ncbi:MAG: Hpt domain-containing protein, partial [Gemmatimonas sp.]
MDQARYAELFRAEAREHLAELDTTLLAFEQHADPAHVATLFRSTHTIKGMAGAMGYHAVEQLSHAMESLLDGVRSGESRVDGDLVALLFEGTDALRASVDDAVAGRGDGSTDALTPLLQRLGAHSELMSRPTPRAPARTSEPLAGLTH